MGTYHFPIVQKSYNGITRFLAKRSHIADLHGEGVIHLSTDSFSHGSITAVVGYCGQEVEQCYFVSQPNASEHWFQIDFLSFNVTITGYTFEVSNDQYHPSWTLYAGNKETELSNIDHQTIDSIPESDINTYTLKQPVSAQIFRLSVNSERYDHQWTLTISRLEFFGTVNYPFRDTCKQKFVISSSIFRSFFIFLIS